jgi:hypothetical protein
MQFGGVFVEFCFAIPSSESTIVSAVELVWKAMELLQLDEDRMLRAEPSLQEALLNGKLQPEEENRKG